MCVCVRVRTDGKEEEEEEEGVRALTFLRSIHPRCKRNGKRKEKIDVRLFQSGE